MSAARVNFFEGQFLRPQDLTAAQEYQVDARRQHDGRMHIWGIVEGLQVVLENGTPVVQPGKAGDGFGREAIVDYPATVDLDQFRLQGTDVLDVWLNYDRQPVSDTTSGCTGGLNVSRWTETPRIELRRRDQGFLDPRRPPGVPDRFFDGSVPFEPIDDPKAPWPIFLGQIRRDMSKPETERFTIDTSGRPYAGVVAAMVDHPADASRIQIGAMGEAESVRYIDGKEIRYQANPDRRFAVFLAEDLEPGDPATIEPRMEIEQDGEVQFHGPVEVQGNLTIQNGAIEFLEQASINEQCVPQNPAIYRWVELPGGGAGVPAVAPVMGGPALAAAAVSGGTAPLDALRINLGSMADRIRTLQIGFTGDDGKFVLCLEVEPRLTPVPGATVRIKGDLRVDGTLDPRHIDLLRLSEDARNALRAPFLAPP